MAGRVLDGQAIAREIRGELARRVSTLRARGVVPGLGVVLVGEDPASKSYVSAKRKACEEMGLFSEERRLPAAASREEVLAAVRALNADPRIHGVLVQMPLPDSSMEDEVVEAVDPAKDVDGFHPVNVGRMLRGLRAFWPCTPHAVLQILRRSGIATAGAHVVIVGRSMIVGRPLAHLLSQKAEWGNATVTICHTGTRDLAFFTRQADILVVAAGRPRTITADMVREGAVVIDVGVNRVPDASSARGYRLVGDVDFEAVKEKASAITPVPGGVGPMTITMLLSNTIEAAERASGG